MRKHNKVRTGLAGLAILGLGAAATTALWTDDAWFRADTALTTFELQGSTNLITWRDADALADAVTFSLPRTMGPGQEYETVVYVRDSQLRAVDAFDFEDDAVTVAGEPVGTVSINGAIEQGSVGTLYYRVPLKVTIEGDLSNSLQGKPVQVQFRIQGESDGR